MKIKLLNDGGYGDMDGVQFPAIVEGRRNGAFFVKASELYRVGANHGEFESYNTEWAFVPGHHAVEAE